MSERPIRTQPAASFLPGGGMILATVVVVDEALKEQAERLAESIIKVPTKSGNEFHDTANGMRFASAPDRLKNYAARAVKALDITPEQFGKVFEGIKLPEGYSVDVAVRMPHEGRVKAITVIRDSNGVAAGDMIRELEADANGNLVVHDTLSRIEKPHRGKGLASAFNEQADEAYRKMGVQRIELTAGYSHGPLVWAQAGFLFRPPGRFENGRQQPYAGETVDFTLEGAKAARWLIEDRIRRIDWLWLKAPNYPNEKRQRLAEDRREKIRKAWEELKPKIARDQDLDGDLTGFITMPWQIAAAGRKLSWWQNEDGEPVEPGTPGAEEWWLGKRILMGGSGVPGDGATWDGVRFL